MMVFVIFQVVNDQDPEFMVEYLVRILFFLCLIAFSIYKRNDLVWVRRLNLITPICFLVSLEFHMFFLDKEMFSSEEEWAFLLNTVFNIN